MALCEKNGLTFFDSQLVSYISQKENEKAQCILAEIENPCILTNSAGQTLLHIASRYGNATLTKHLIGLGFEVHARDKFGVTPLALAVQYRHKDTIEILLEANADIYDSEYRTCPLQVIHSAYMEKRRPGNNIQGIWKMFFNKVNEDYRKDKRATLVKIWNSKCSLHCAFMLVRNRKSTEYWIRNGYDVNTPEPLSQCTALHAAVASSDFSNIKVLIENGANVNALDRLGRTPLCYYKYYSKDKPGKIEMLKYLIDSGATFTLSSSPGSVGSLEHLLSYGNVKTVEMVLQSDIDFKATGRLDMTPLHFLANNTTPDIMKLLHGKTFDVNARDVKGDTPLMLAILKNKNFSSVEFLLNNGANVNAENNEGQTPLCYSVNCALIKEKIPKVTEEICKFLLQRGAEIQHVFKRYKKKKVIDEQTTIFDMITNRKKFEISKVLLAQLVLNNILHGEVITDIIRTKIKSNEILKEQFNTCNEQIEKMKAAKVNDSLTLFDLMTAKEEDLMVHAIDFEFVSKIDELVSITIGENSYYEEIIKKRIGDVVKNLKSAEEKVETVAAQSTCCIS